MKRLVAALLVSFATQAAGQANVQKSDYELEQERLNWKEQEVTLPPPPKGDLIEFFVSAASSFKFFIDPASLSVGADDVVRYTLVARSSSGASNVSYEGIRCDRPPISRIYAYSDGNTWSKNTRSDWRPIEEKQVQRWHSELAMHYFCPEGMRIHTVAEGLNALRRGGHPSVQDSSRRRY